ncbi:hypothetical protein CEUSTIGMA_g3934.t1 [Chlamydomonas eustigma]|uniref:Reverse transcriptase/retrotransposon-derived protein RNase H-like domain-containing protein n=1 Tax=Chlamydomonas eustigma TaxID=1157962 RepID=A0A250X0M3_9CHLO|nr:hypothetical protein CEUSTIGMA_g3934.t1 [Chlamydomonas eustigma]|eukprot:GAX76489.1 hypothetical protein CEUSTIGMA_g3934.t1 [Chlamydomonas eustigma]
MLHDMNRVPEALKEDLLAVLEKHGSAIFANDLPPGLLPNVLPCRAILLLEHSVRPIFRQRHRLLPLENEVIEKEVKSLLDKGLIQPPIFGDPILFLSKPDDDIAILSKTPEEHVKHVEMTLKLLHDAKLLVKLRKCHFFQPEIKFLGHILSARGVQADPQKLKAVKEWQNPKHRKELLQFLGLCNYFRKHVPQFSRIAAPLYHLTKNTVPWSFDSVYQNAFSQLKQALSNPPVLAYPNPDLPYELITDASLTRCGAVLTQNGNPIAYFSSKFCPSEQNYTTIEQEMLGVVKASKEWRCYLLTETNLLLS